MSRKEKLFRAIVVMGAAITAPACGDDRCAKCAPDANPNPDAVATSDATPSDAGTDGPAPSDAQVDAVLIL